MIGLRISVIFFFFVLCGLSCLAGNNQIFHLIDVNSRDYKITDVAVEYSDAKITDGFRVKKNNQTTLIPWSAITDLKFEASDENSSEGFVKCSVKFTDGSTLSFSCMNGTLLGTTRNGDYRMPLDKVIELKAVRLSGFSRSAEITKAG